jgi:hypothetical protein
MRTTVEGFIHRENIKLFTEQLEAPITEAKRKMLLRLLAQEEAKADELVVKSKADQFDAKPLVNGRARRLL